MKYSALTHTSYIIKGTFIDSLVTFCNQRNFVMKYWTRVSCDV